MLPIGQEEVVAADIGILPVFCEFLRFCDLLLKALGDLRLLRGTAVDGKLFERQSGLMDEHRGIEADGSADGGEITLGIQCERTEQMIFRDFQMP